MGPVHDSKNNVVRTLSNPKGEARTQHARTPHHLLNGTFTPNGLHFVISHAGNPDIDPDKHRLVIHGLVKQPLEFTLDALMRYPMVSRMSFIQCGGNSAPLFSNEPIQGSVQALHGLVSCAEWTGVPLSTLIEEAGIDPKAKWVIAEGADAPHLSRSVPLMKALDDALLVLSERGEDQCRGMVIRCGWFFPDGEGKHEREILTPHSADRIAQYELLRSEDIRAGSAGRQGLPILFHPGGEIVHHTSLARTLAEGAGIV